jgi:hypothetical protein
VPFDFSNDCDGFHCVYILTPAIYSKRLYNSKILNIFNGSFSFFSENRFNPSPDFHFGFIVYVNIMLEECVGSVKTDKSIPVRHGFLLTGFRIYERVPEDGEGSDGSVGAHLDKFSHLLEAGPADTARRYVNLAALGAFGPQNFTVLLQLPEEFAAVHAHRVIKRLTGIAGFYYQSFDLVHVFFLWFPEAISKNGFWFKVAADASCKPESYSWYFEELQRAPNKEIGPKDFFELASTSLVSLSRAV